jgi:methionyl-tRNA synthetase
MRTLITSALPYVNGIKHLGNLVGSMLPADVYARYLRRRGDEVLCLCATDEHGTPAELAALEAGLPVEEFCRQQHELQKSLAERFGLAFDHFGRSSSHANHDLTRHFARSLEANGFIEERTLQQIYSRADGRFLPDRYVIGTCPHCGYTAARGDQCESCTRLLDPTDLLAPRSAISGSADLEVRATRHLFLLQSKLAGELRDWVTRHEEWPVLTRSIALKWLDEGLRDRCITRDLKWGIPVDRPGFEGKVFYVWFDAPIEYIGATVEWATSVSPPRDWERWWIAASDVRYVQFMAKDNIPFHTVGFPATILGSREEWKLVDYVKGFNWLNYYGGKFSTSQKRGVFMNDALDILPADCWRYYLLANAPESNDSEFTWEQLAATVNSDLADNLGNFVLRTLKLVDKAFGAAVPAGGEPTEAEAAVARELEAHVVAYGAALAGVQFRRAIESLRAAWSVGNNYLAREAPWTALKVDRDRAACVLRTAINLIRIYAAMAWPVIPFTSERLFSCLGLADDESQWIAGDVQRELVQLRPGRTFTVPAVLFRKITDDDVAAWTARFGGREAKR